MTIKTAIIGLGIMGRRMAEHMALHPDFSVVAMWDPDPASCALAQAVIPATAISADAQEAIAQADLVYLACPPMPRKTYAEMAAAAGKALFLEKPLGTDVAQSRDLVRKIGACNVPAAVNFTQAAGDALAEVTAAAQSGTLGALRARILL
ncbi:MAG: Gfo/Idh/MocA family oxidoreductase [Sulfitobacter sp.]